MKTFTRDQILNAAEKYMDNNPSGNDINDGVNWILSYLENKTEEPFFDKEFQNDLNKYIGEIKEQISSLEDAGNKLHDTFANLGNLNKNENN